VLEHPAYTDAWAAYGLPVPVRWGGWSRGLCGGWVCHVEQGRYGHAAKKSTWLYAHSIGDPPSMRWGYVHDSIPGETRWRDSAKRERARAPVSWCGNHVRDGEDRPRLGKRAAIATPPEFRDLLLAIARSSTVGESRVTAPRGAEETT